MLQSKRTCDLDEVWSYDEVGTGNGSIRNEARAVAVLIVRRSNQVEQET